MSRHDRIPSGTETEAAPIPLRREAEGKAPPPPAEAPARRGPSRKKLLLGAVAITALVGGGLWGHEYWTTGRFMIETDDAYVQADITEISPRIQGYVAEAPVAENAHVDKGDVILRLDDGDYRIALETAQGRVATQDQALTRIDAQIEAARAAVAQARAQEDAAQAALDNAQATAERTRNLTDRKVVAQAQLDDATEALATTRARLTAAQAATDSAQANVAVLQAQRAEAEGSRHELELAVKQAQRNLDLTVLRAPQAGILANTGFELGDLVAPGARLAALVPDDSLYVEANYKETELAEIAPGSHVDVTIDALPDRHFEGVVASTAPATGSVFSLLPPENATGNFTKVVQRVPVRIDLTDAGLPRGLRAGLSAVVSVDTRTTPRATE